MELLINGKVVGFFSEAAFDGLASDENSEEQGSASSLLSAAIALQKDQDFVRGDFLLQHYEDEQGTSRIRLELVADALISSEEDQAFKEKYGLTKAEVTAINQVIKDVKRSDDSGEEGVCEEVSSEEEMEEERKRDFRTTLGLLASFLFVLGFAFAIKHVLFRNRQG